MGRYAQVHTETGFVVGVIEWDGNPKTWKPPKGYTMIEDKDVVAGPGFRYAASKSGKSGKFTPPPTGDAGEDTPDAAT